MEAVNSMRLVLNALLGRHALRSTGAGSIKHEPGTLSRPFHTRLGLSRSVMGFSSSGL